MLQLHLELLLLLLVLLHVFIVRLDSYWADILAYFLLLTSEGWICVSKVDQIILLIKSFLVRSRLYEVALCEIIDTLYQNFGLLSVPFA